MTLSDVGVKSAKPMDKRYMIGDGDTLYLEVMTTGKKYWRLRYFKDSKASWHSIGEYPAITLSEARDRKAAMKQRLRDGLPLVAEKTDEKLNTFANVTEEWLVSVHDMKVSRDKDRQYTRNRLNTHVLPFIGEREIATIKSSDILVMLKRLEAIGTYEMARRVRSICSQIFCYAIATGRVENDPTYALKGAIPPAKPKHHASITTPSDISVLLRAIDAYPQTVVRCAMWFSAYTFCRPEEIRHADLILRRRSGDCRAKK
ncbi:hypothetical protein FACS1894216_02070 [Synergistales bacterium]|nr:hypothetical protein FACS1894216_02070 [Synergistales bacterium]